MSSQYPHRLMSKQNYGEIKMKKNTRGIATGAVIAALYVALTYVFSFMASGVIQVRLSEALSALVYFTPWAIPGVTVGCLISNILTGCALYDVIFGTLATFAGALSAYFLRRFKWLVPVPTVLFNTLIIPRVLKHVYGAAEALSLLTVTVFAGEAISAGVLGILLIFAFEKRRHIFK